MTGGKTLGQVRAELETALGAGPAGTGQVAESLRRFLAAGAGERDAPKPPPAARPKPKPRPATKRNR